MSDSTRKPNKLVAMALLLLVLVGISPHSVLAATPNAAAANKQVAKSFPTDKVLTVEIQLAETDLTHLLANPAQEMEYGGSITWNGKQINNVAVRTKGNSSLNSVARSDSQRYSLKIDLNEYVKGQNLDGISTINLNNGFSDASFMREYLSYEAFASLGVSVPATTWVQLTVNGQLWGLFLAVEQIGAPYLERHFGNNQGDLYKPANQSGQGADLKWYGDQYSAYTGITYKTNGTNSTHQPILAMLDALNNGGDLDQHLDVDGILRYLAVSTVLLNFDSYQGSFAHNYYLYEQKGKFTVLPWDLNMSFGGFSMGTTMDQLIGVKIDEPTLGAVAERPLIARLLAVPEYRNRYHEYIQDLITGYLEPARLEARARQVMALIDPYVKADPTKFVTYEQFQQSLDAAIPAAGAVPPGGQGAAGGPGFQAGPGLRGPGGQGGPGFPGGGASVGILTLMRLRIPNVQQQLDGTLPSQGDGSGLGAQGGFPRGGPGGRQGNQGPMGPGQPPGEMAAGGPNPQIGGPGQVIAPGVDETARMASPAVSPDMVLPLAAAVGLLLAATAFLRFQRPRCSRP